MATGTVRCYSGSRFGERPTRIRFGDQELAVAHVVRQWRTPAGLGFDVIVTGGRRFRLVHDQAGDCWSVEEIGANAHR